MPATYSSRAAAWLVVLLPLFSSRVAAIEDCKKKGEQPLEFRFFTDNNSFRDNGWTLECDYEDGKKKLLWNAPIGSLEESDRTEVIREATCVPDTATCFLHLFDAHGDGLQGRENGDSTPFSGWFAFLHGATTVGTYKNLENPAFSEMVYCVGPDCEQKPLEVQTNDKNCQDMLYLAMKLDDKPEDTTYQLVCGSDQKVIWDGKDFTEAGALIEEETCLPKDACCEFTVTDGDTQGLTSSPNPGFLYLELNFDPLLEYDGSTGEEFNVLSKSFGCKNDVTTVKEFHPTDLSEMDKIAAQMIQDELKDEPDGATTQETTGESNEEPMGFKPSDDDYQSFNDDGTSFGKWNDDNNEFTDDVAYSNTEEPSGTEPPTVINPDILENDDVGWITKPYDDDDMGQNDDTQWVDKPFDDDDDGVQSMQDDVVENDDTEWINKPFNDDELDSELTSLEDLVAEADKSKGQPGINGNIATVAMLQGEQTGGLGKGAKIALGVVIPLLVIWTIALSWYSLKEYLYDRFGTNAEDEVIEKNTQRNENSSQESYSEDDLRSHSSLEDV